MSNHPSSFGRLATLMLFMGAVAVACAGGGKQMATAPRNRPTHKVAHAPTHTPTRRPPSPTPSPTKPPATPTASPTATATPTPTPTKRPVDRTLPFKDNFSRTSSGWPIQKFRDGSRIGYRGGKYQAYIAEPGTVLFMPIHVTARNVKIDADVSHVRGSTDSYSGVICRSRKKSPGYTYYFVVTNDGYYGVFRREGGIKTIRQLDYKGMRPSRYIKLGKHARNHIQTVCDQSKLSLYVNGHRLARVTDRTFKTGRIGFVAGDYSGGKGSVTISFDNFNARKP